MRRLESRLLGAAGPPIAGVVVDLDDTLYPQAAWLSGACDAVAELAGRWGVAPGEMRAALTAVLAQGSDRGGTIDRALAAVGAGEAPVAPLVAAFRAYAPERLEPYPGVRTALAQLAAELQVALVTDGDPAGQRAKLAATGLGDLLSAAVFSDEIGREHRKPDPVGLRRACEALGLPPDHVVVIGDRPDKDVEAAARAGMRAVRVRTGEYRTRPDLPGTWAIATSFPAAVRLVLEVRVREHLPTRRRAGRPAPPDTASLGGAAL